MGTSRTRAPRARPPAVLAASLVVLVAALLTGQSSAAAAWLIAGSGPADAVATVVPRGATPTVVRSSDLFTPRLFTISWSTTRVGGPPGRPATAYIIKRTGGSGAALSGTCDNGGGRYTPSPANAEAETHSCTDTVPATTLGTSTYTWTVQPVFHKWTGPVSVGATGTA